MSKRNRLFGLIGTVAAYSIANLAARKWYLRWGATPEEASGALPGDEFATRVSCTRAITINAPVAEVWRWLVQIGQDRAGFYSYWMLEDIGLAGIRNADRIVPEWQHLQAGDRVRLAAREVYGDAPLLRVLALEENHYFVLEGWGAFVLRALDDRTTRFIIRTHAGQMTAVQQAIAATLFDPIHFVMERKMMLGIKRRAEKNARRPEAKHSERKAS